MMLNYLKQTAIFGTKYWGHTEHGGEIQVFPAGSEVEKARERTNISTPQNPVSTSPLLKIEDFIIYCTLYHDVYIHVNVIYVCYLLNIRFLKLETTLMDLGISFNTYFSILQIISSQYLLRWKNKWINN